jgi:hypothetical protein
MPSLSSSDSTNADPQMQSYGRPSTGLHSSASQGSIGGNPRFDVFDWYPKYQSCQQYFLDHSQYSASVQALAAFINILLPFQRSPHSVNSSIGTSHTSASARGQAPRGMHSPTSGSSVPPPCIANTFRQETCSHWHGLFPASYRASLATIGRLGSGQCRKLREGSICC